MIVIGLLRLEEHVAAGPGCRCRTGRAEPSVTPPMFTAPLLVM